jgi:putative redox protein
MAIARGGAKSTKVDLSVGELALVADEEVAEGGTNVGPAPTELLLSALAACTAMTLGLYARRKGWPLEDTIVHVDRVKAAVEPGAPIPKDEITRTIQLVGPLDDEQRTRLADIAEKCPVHKILATANVIRTSISA